MRTSIPGDSNDVTTPLATGVIPGGGAGASDPTATRSKTEANAHPSR
eukprot:CAMPEP_0174908528 /NCGR_PEP_ID=MMETSP0167-20121228/65109_1 /TAXON_ID=38298 /ORGANISM="Rhodella maculata, Strain CCMP736" /LENGTH=46 /DNA_ID= /DNA_START= /DNA_END= /DNA_ORIENTATION=